MASSNTINAIYSESTITPVLSFGGTSTGITYSDQVGGYAQIGNFVFFWITIALTNKGSSTGSCLISGLPSNPVVALTATLRNTTVTAAGGYLQANVLTNGTIQLENITTAAPPTLIDNTGFQNTSEINIAGWYAIA